MPISRIAKEQFNPQNANEKGEQRTNSHAPERPKAGSKPAEPKFVDKEKPGHGHPLMGEIPKDGEGAC